MNEPEIDLKDLDWNELKQCKGTIDNYYDQYGNWWLMFIASETNVFYILDFKPAFLEDEGTET